MKTLKIFILFFIFLINVQADVILKSANTFVKGESFIFQFEAIGSSVKFPEIKEIDGYLVEDLGTSRSLQIINGNYDEKISKNYRIAPKNDFTIPSFTFEINGEKVKTKAKTIKAKVISKTTSDDFDLSLNSSKKELFVGEDLIVKLIFKYKRGLQITNLGFEQPHFQDFWYKKIDNSSKRFEENGYIIQELDFLLFPQKSGLLKINPLRVDAQLMSSSGNSTFGFFSTIPKVVKVYSNDLEFNVKELPQGVNLIGDFDIEASVDKKEVKPGESVSYKVNITGIGNFDDIQDIKLDLENATVYDNKPQVQTKFSQKGYEGTYSKVYSIIPNSSMQIPEISFKYYSKKENKVVTKKSKAFNIKLIGQEIKKTVLEKAKEIEAVKKEIIIEKESSLEDKILYFVFGVFSTLLIFGLIKYVKLQNSKKSHEDIPLISQVKKTKNKNELMKTLVPYVKKDMELDSLIYECEGDKEFKILKKQIIELLKKINI